jgi:hypothetical protein
MKQPYTLPEGHTSETKGKQQKKSCKTSPAHTLYLKNGSNSFYLGGDGEDCTGAEGYSGREWKGL